MASLLPTPEPADPVEGAPGHFTHSNWVKQSVKNLDVGTVHTDQVQSLYGRNRIQNGDFSVNQRGVTSGSLSTGQYLGDRWLGGSVGGTCTGSIQTATTGELPESAKQYIRLVSSGQAATTDYTQVFNRVESVRSLSGKTVTTSFWARTASGTPKVAVGFNQRFGSGGSPSAIVNTYAGQVTLSTVWSRYSITVALPSIAGKTLGTNGDDSLELVLWTSCGSAYGSQNGSLGIQTATIDIWGVQLEEGAYATPYEQKSYADELRACQRYFVRLGGADTFSLLGAGASTSTTTVWVIIDLPVRTRVVPAISGVGMRFHDGASVFTPTAFPTIAAGQWSGTKFAVSATVTPAMPSSAKPIFLDTGALASYMDCNCEL